MAETFLKTNLFNANCATFAPSFVKRAAVLLQAGGLIPINMTEQELLRRESLAKLREAGIDPYPAEMYHVTAFATDIIANYQEEVLEDGSKNRLNYQEVSLAGRVMASREAGKALFMNLQDTTGRIQLYLRRDDFMEGEEADSQRQRDMRESQG